MLEVLWEIFDYSDFMARGSCGRWSVFYEVMYKWSHFGIFVEYLCIPASGVLTAWTMLKSGMYPVVQYKTVGISLIPFSLATGAFVVMCGVGHLLDGVGSFYWPAYRLFSWWHLATFLVGLWSLWYLGRIALKQILILYLVQKRGRDLRIDTGYRE